MTDDESEPTNLILERLRRIDEGQELIRRDIRELRDEILALRNQVHSLAGDGLRREAAIAALTLDMDRVNARLALSDE